MRRPAAPDLTVRYDGSERTFAAGHDVVVGRDLRADVRIAHPLISRAHLVLRFDHGRWMAIDNGSLNGMFVNGRRVPSVDIGDGLILNVGNPDGPAMSFGLGRHQGSVGRPPQASDMRVSVPPSSPSWPANPSRGAATVGQWQPPPSQAQPT